MNKVLAISMAISSQLALAPSDFADDIERKVI